MDNIINEVKSIWSTYGVYLTIVKGSPINSSGIPASLNLHQAEDLLSSVNKPANYIHVFIAKSADASLGTDGLYGINIHYGYGGEGYGFFDCANLASGDPSWRTGESSSYYLNRTGCIIFSNNIENEIPNAQGWTSTWVYAWVIAHELGHSMGIYKHSDSVPNLMHEPLFDNSYSVYKEVLQESLDFLNTRDLLGVKTVSVGNNIGQ